MLHKDLQKLLLLQMERILAASFMLFALVFLLSHYFLILFLQEQSSQDWRQLQVTRLLAMIVQTKGIESN